MPQQCVCARRQLRLVLLTGLVQAVLTGLPAVAQESGPSLLNRLESRVAERPYEAASWRLLGRAREQQGDQQGALEAFARSAELDPLSAAAQFDLARLSLAAGDDHEAVQHFSEAVRLAPDSPYAQQAREFLQNRAGPDEVILPAGYEGRRFDRSDLVPALRPSAERLDRAWSEGENLPSPWGFRLETGVLFNTNVALAPTSRELATGSRESFQAFLLPELEYAALNTATWRAGPSFRGLFNVNENDLRSLNLQSYQPGLFLERLIFLDAAILIPRLAYSYTHDVFDGHTFADRHAVTLSSSVVWPSLNETHLYWVADFTNYADDGIAPKVTSSDGWTNTLGASHRLYFERGWVQSVSAGVEGQLVDAEGANFSYDGIGLFSDAEIPIVTRLSLLLNSGVSYRRYPDARLDPSRDELVWHAGARLRLELAQHWSAAAVFNYDRFDSRNELFSADRMILGVTTTVEY